MTCGGTANGKAAGQDVFHCHLHILPRFENDSFGLRLPKSYPQRPSVASWIGSPTVSGR